MKNDIFSDDNIAQSNWFKFDKIGDKISGTLIETFEKEASGDFDAQKVYVILDENGEEYNVGFSVGKTFIHTRMKTAQIGQYIGFNFVKEMPSRTKGYASAKSVVPYKQVDKETGKPVLNEEWLQESGITTNDVADEEVEVSIAPFK